MLNTVRFASREDAEKVATYLSLMASVNATVELCTEDAGVDDENPSWYEIAIDRHGSYYPANFAAISVAIAEAGVIPLNRPDPERK